MKFTDGYWSIRDGLTVAHPAHAHEFELQSESLVAYAPAKRVRQRGDTINATLFTIKFSSPMPDVVCVSFRHFAGEQLKPPQFALESSPPEELRAAVSVSEDDDFVTLTGGKLSVRVPRQNAWRIEFMAENRTITFSDARGLGLVETADGDTYVHEQLSLGVGENVYGLGERFTAFVKNGQPIDIWNQDGGTSSEQAYKNIPFYLTNRGYGVFVNDPGAVSFEVASEKVERVQFSVPGQALEYFVIYGPTPKEILEKYTALTGRPALPPAWSFGLWLSTSFTTSYDEATVTSFIEGMAERALPLHVFHFDCFWMKEFHWSDFQWDPRTFPDPPGMLARLKARGLHICVWINPYIAQRSALFADGMQNGYLVKKPNGDVWQVDKWQPGMGLVDFTNPAARQWFGDKLRLLLDMGVDCFKTDFGERIPTEVVYFDGADVVKMHNYYTYLYNKTVFEVLRERRGQGEAVVFARSATTGGQRFPVHWGGDCESSFVAMAESLRGGLSLGLSGFGFWSHDIGGFEGTPPTDVYKRWAAFGLLSSHSRLHGSQSYRVPWLFDEEAVEVVRTFTNLKCRLMPYLYAHAVQAAQKGTPVMRAMLLEFPDDPTCDYLDRQYMLGDSLLIAPVLSSDGWVTYYVPAGRWTNLLTGAVVEGARWVREQHDFLTLPLLVRPNSILPIGNHIDRPDYDYAEGVTLEIYELANPSEITVVIPSTSGAVDTTFVVKRSDGTLTVERQGPSKPWQVLLVNIPSVATIEGGTVERVSRGALGTPNADALTFHLD